MSDDVFEYDHEDGQMHNARGLLRKVYWNFINRSSSNHQHFLQTTHYKSDILTRQTFQRNATVF